MSRKWTVIATALLLICTHARASEQVLRAETPVFADSYGTSVAIDGPLAVVGMPGDDTIANDAGAAYVYEQTTMGWTLLQTFYGANADDQFGYSVAVVAGHERLGVDDVVAVGSVNGPGVLDHTGNVTMYRRSAPAATFSYEQIVSSDESQNYDSFGYAIALDLSVPSDSTSGVPVFTLAVTAPTDYIVNVGPDVGSVYVFQGPPTGLGGWGPITKVVPGDLVGGDELGHSLDISGDFIIAGATGWPYGNNPEGVAYLIRRFYDTGSGAFNWALNSRLKASDGASGDQFGARVAIDGGVPVVAAPHADNGGGEGAVYVFCCKTSVGYDLTESSKIAAPDPHNRTNFGSVLDIDKGLVIVGDATYPGYLDVFHADMTGTWSWSFSETTAISDPDANRADALALSVPNAIAGDPFHNGGGAAHIITDNILNDPIFRAGFE
ncbi:MAG: FG-GAP repeat protein [Rudaea sp.]